MSTLTRIAFPISNIWDRGPKPDQKDPTSFTAGGGTPAPGVIATEGIDKSQDSLTQFIRSLTNLFALRGSETLQQGTDVFGKGISTLDAPLSYWSKLLSGDKTAMMEAIAPEANMITSQYDSARRAVANLSPRGGARSSTMASIPFRAQSDISTLLQKVRPGAATSLANLGTNMAGLGLGQEGVGAGLLGSAQQGALTRRSQNLQEDVSNRQQIASIGQALGGFIAMLLGGGGGGGGGSTSSGTMDFSKYFKGMGF